MYSMDVAESAPWLADSATSWQGSTPNADAGHLCIMKKSTFPSSRS